MSDITNTDELPIGTKNGCLTIVGGFEEYEKYRDAEANRNIEEYIRIKEEYLLTGKKEFVNPDGRTIYYSFLSEANPVAEIDRRIEEEKNWRNDTSKPIYKVKCKCGRTQFMTHYRFAKKRYRYCDTAYDSGRHYVSMNECGLRASEKENQLKNAERIKDAYYDAVLPFSVHESLEIIGFGEDKETVITRQSRKRKLPYISVSRTYKCKCYLCGKEWLFSYTDFDIHNDVYGYRAEEGFYCDAHCDCHFISSFQWRTLDILRKHGIAYKVEISFPDLLGESGRNELRFDFGLYSPDGKLYTLLECQGKQHYIPVKKYGGTRQFKYQKMNDDLKKEYVKKQGIPLIEIPYTCNTYSKEEVFLKGMGLFEMTQDEAEKKLFEEFPDKSQYWWDAISDGQSPIMVLEELRRSSHS